MALATSLWSAGYAMEFYSPSLEMMLFWAKVEYLGIVTIPVAWFVFSLSYVSPLSYLEIFRGRYLLLWIIPGLTLVMVVTNSVHGLIWSEISLAQVGPFSTLALNYGLWFWVHLIYSYTLLLIGSILLVNVLLNTIRFQRWQTGLVLIAILIPWISNFLYISDFNPLPYIDLTPFAFFFACMLLFISLYQFSLGSSMPITHKSMLEGMSAGIMVLDSQNRILDLNKATQKIIDLPGTKAVGLPITQVMPWMSEQISLYTGKEFITKVQVGQGTDQHTYQVSITPLSGRDDSIRGNLLVVRELTKQSEVSKNSQQTDWMQEIINLEPDAMLLLNREAKISLANLEAENIFGYLRDEMLDLGLDSLIPERFHHQHRENVGTYFSDPVARPMGAQMSLYARRRDGSEFPVDISLNPLKIGEDLFVACAVRDISERKRAEMALREREETYQALFEHSNDAIFLLSPSRIHLQVNQKAADLLGYTREELIGMSIFDIVVPTEYPEALNRYASLTRGERVPIYERNFRKKDGSTITVEINLSLIRDNDGKPVMIQSIVRDISERKMIQQKQLEMLEEIKHSRENLRVMAARIENTREEERRDLADKLHDRVGQNLTGININLNIISNLVIREDFNAIQSRLEDTIELVEETTRLVRNVMAELHPPLLDDYGLFSALRWYIDKYSQRTNIQTILLGEECQPRLPAHVELVLFRIVQEALNNITKHAQADQVTVILNSTSQIATLSVKDNGRGFDAVLLSKSDKEPHWGLLNMQEKAHSIGGRMMITTAPGQGVNISVEVPREVRDD